MEQILTKKYDKLYLVIYSDLKLDRKLQEVNEAIYFLLYSHLANQKIDWSA